MDDRELQNTSTVPDAGTPAPAPVPDTPDVSALAVVSPDRQQQQSQMVSNPQPAPSQPDANANHPAIQSASVLHTIAETLSGGPRYKPVIDVNTGKRTLQRIPMDRKDIGMAIALSAITGALSGLQAKGPNATAEAAGRGFAAVSQMRQQADQQQDERASQDFARRMAVTEANMRMLNNAIQIGRLQREDHDSMVNSYAEQLQDLKDNAPDAIKASGVSEEDAKDLQKFPVMDYLRIPDGVVPRLGPDGQQVSINGVPQWDNTYSLIDRNAKANLVDDQGEPRNWVKDAISWGLPGYTQSLYKLRPDSATISLAAAGRAQHQVVMLNALQTELNSFTSSFGKDKSGKPVVQPIDLKAALKSDPTLLNAIQHFQRAAGASTQPDRQIDAMRQDPKTASYAAKIIGLFGADSLEQFKQNRENREAAEKERAKKLGEENTPGGQASIAHTRAETAKLIHDMSQASVSAKNSDGSWNPNSVPVALVEGTMDPTQLTKRSKDYNSTIEQANAYSREKYGKPFDMAQAQSDYKFATNAGTQNVLKYLNSLTGADNKSGNLGELINQSNRIARTDFPALNNGAAWARLQTGDAQMAAYRAAVTEVADQVAKIMQGGGTGGGTSDAKLKQAQDLFDKGFSKDQIVGVAQTLRSLLANRKAELIGDNRYLRKQYTPQATQPNQSAGSKAAGGFFANVPGAQVRE